MEIQQRIHGLLRQMSSTGLVAARRLFCTELGYGRVHELLSLHDWPSRARDVLAEAPTVLARHNSVGGSFDIIYARLVEPRRDQVFPLSLEAERMVVRQLIQDHPCALFVFSDPDEEHWHLVNVRYDKETTERRVFRRMAIGPHERLRTAAARLSLLDLSGLRPDGSDLSAVDLQQRHDRAFDVEAVTSEFFQGFQRVFRTLRLDLELQTGDARWAHGFALRFLSRLMFVHFVQCRRWLGDDPHFLQRFWRTYRQSGPRDDTFASEWLDVLFFDGFGSRSGPGRAEWQHFPAAIRDALAMAPYLGNRLFERNELDRAHALTITDARCQQLLQFLQAYNFSIKEDTPLDQEVAVDPAMIGRVYESLIHVSEGSDERSEAGIFYTPRVEIDLMCRLSLVDWLTNHLGREHRASLYETVFALEPQKKEKADGALAERNLWPRMNTLLRSVTVVDPACGSGSFLVGMLYVLDDLLARANTQLAVEETPLQRKKSIIRDSLYGVDIMSWAVEIAGLRLWLQLVVDLPLAPPWRDSDPPLPDLSMKVRWGDSLVQEERGINLDLWRVGKLVSQPAQARVARWKDEKRRFYDHDPERRYRSKEQLLLAERDLFCDLLDARAQTISSRLAAIAAMLPTDTDQPTKGRITQAQHGSGGLERERDHLQLEKRRVDCARQVLQSAREVPFVWNLAFIEAFEGERGGFDIIIGNPPYVRQERIHDPRRLLARVTATDKKKYKAKLARTLYTAWPRTFGYDCLQDRARWRLDARSDLFSYFYLHGLSLLNDKGTLCFITSSSWLDVRYGRDLQEFLLTRGQVKLVIDNQARRSFAAADVNTAIVLLGAAHDCRAARPASLQLLARFVMLTGPFDQVLNPTIWTEIEGRTSRWTTSECRVLPMRQAELLESGKDATGRRFVGDKWGAKYLRAPDIYWMILERCRDKLVRLGNVARVQRGLTTGANAFFFLDEQELADWAIEEEFLVPAVKSPRHCSRIWLELEKETRLHLFMCHLERDDLRGTQALQYIEYGESQGYDRRPTCRSRPRWWDLGFRTGACTQCNYLVDEVMRFYASETPFLASDNFQELHSEIKPEALAAACNSTVCQLAVNVLGRSNFGGGLLKVQTYEVENLLIPDPLLLDDEVNHLIRNVSLLKLSDPERLVLDDIICRMLGLTMGERDAVLEAVTNLAATRRAKAQMVRVNQLIPLRSREITDR